jgi:hypothetical protein
VGRARGLALVVAAAVLLAACGGISRDELDQESQARGGGIGETIALEGLDAIEAATGEPVRFESMTVNRDSMTIAVLAPDSDDALDNWTYQSNGNLIGPDPVNGAPTAEVLSQTLMGTDDVALDDLDEIVDDALEHTHFDGGYAQSVSIYRNPGERPRINVSVTSPRRNATVVYRGDGHRIEGAS